MKKSKLVSILSLILLGGVVFASTANTTIQDSLKEEARKFIILGDDSDEIVSEPINKGKESGESLSAGEFNRVLEMLSATDNMLIGGNLQTCGADEVMYGISSNGTILCKVLDVPDDKYTIQITHEDYGGDNEFCEISSIETCPFTSRSLVIKDDWNQPQCQAWAEYAFKEQCGTNINWAWNGTTGTGAESSDTPDYKLVIFANDFEGSSERCSIGSTRDCPFTLRTTSRSEWTLQQCQDEAEAEFAARCGQTLNWTWDSSSGLNGSPN